MAKISRIALDEVTDALDRYIAEVQDADLAPNTKRTSILNARQFVRWLNDDFEPGGTTRRIR